MSQSIPTWCWYCKQEIPTVADVCPYCGKHLNDATKVVRCQKCGKFLLKNVPNCTQCGEPAPQPEAPLPPDEAAEPTEPPMDLPWGTEVATQTSQTPEMTKMFEQLETLSARKAQSDASGGGAKGSASIILIAVLLVAAVLGISLGVSRATANRSPRPTYCADDQHQWIEADCTTPKTCAVCGKTEGESEGHRFVENVCAVCGDYQWLFYFTDTDSERSGSEVVFRGNVKNFTDTKVQSLQIKVQLYDANKTLVETLPGAAVETAGLAPFESTPWQVRCNDSSIQWKYWRAYVSDYSSEA